MYWSNQMLDKSKWLTRRGQCPRREFLKIEDWGFYRPEKRRMHPIETTFRIADNSDTEILVKFIQEFYEYDGHPFDENTVRKALQQILKDDSLGRVWLLQSGSEAIGYIILTFGYSLEYRGRDAFIDELYIRESYRGRGVGSSAINFIESVCPSLGIQALHLEVERENTKAQSFYQKVGFTDQDRYLMTKWIAR
jgi:ribosomal protein S18 acetylase RimI-like enzyme